MIARCSAGSSKAATDSGRPTTSASSARRQPASLSTGAAVTLAVCARSAGMLARSAAPSPRQKTCTSCRCARWRISLKVTILSPRSGGKGTRWHTKKIRILGRPRASPSQASRVNPRFLRRRLLPSGGSHVHASQILVSWLKARVISDICLGAATPRRDFVPRIDAWISPRAAERVRMEVAEGGAGATESRRRNPSGAPVNAILDYLEQSRDAVQAAIDDPAFSAAIADIVEATATALGPWPQAAAGRQWRQRRRRPAHRR